MSNLMIFWVKYAAFMALFFLPGGLGEDQGICIGIGIGLWELFQLAPCRKEFFFGGGFFLNSGKKKGGEWGGRRQNKTVMILLHISVRTYDTL